jgi:hypothetical protein
MEAAREAVREAMAEANANKSKKKKKKKRGRGGSSSSDSDGGGGGGSDSDGGAPQWKKKRKQKQQQQQEEEEAAAKQSYRDRAKERRSGNAGFEDVSAYLSQNIAEAGASSAAVASTAHTASNAHAARTRMKKKKKTKGAVSLGDRILRVLRAAGSFAEGNHTTPTSAVKSKKYAKKRRADLAQWTEGGLIYHFDVTPGIDPRTYTDSMVIPTEVLHGDAGSSGVETGVVRLTDRQSNPELGADLLEAVTCGFRRAKEGLKDVHPALLKQQQRQQALELQKAKEAVQQKLAEQSKRAAAAAATAAATRQKKQSVAASDGKNYEEDDDENDDEDDDDDDIFADVGEYQPSEGDCESDRGGDGNSNEGDDEKGNDDKVAGAKEADLSATLDLRVNGILYYSKPGQGIDTVRVLKMHPGLPAPTDSLTVRVVASFDAQRIGRELNILPGSGLSSARPVDPSRLALMLPPQFRQRCTSTAVNNELAWMSIEVDMCDYVLKSTQ